jgi:hypothetical protein
MRRGYVTVTVTVTLTIATVNSAVSRTVRDLVAGAT